MSAAAGDDPDFLALSERKRRRIDRVFDKALPRSRATRKRAARTDRGGSVKRPRLDQSGLSRGRSALEDDADDGGGFVVDEYEGPIGDGMSGGFVPADIHVEEQAAAEGAFIPDDDDSDAGGGFVLDDDGPEAEQYGSAPSKILAQPSRGHQSRSTALRTGKIPLSSIPALLARLHLPADDDVLAVFRSSATGWSAAASSPGEDGAVARRTRGKAAEEDELGVERKDFRAVCAALMGGNEDGDDEMGRGSESESDASDGPDADLESESDRASDGGRGGQGGESESEDDDDDEEDAFRLSEDEGSDLSSLSSDSEYGASRRRTRAARDRPSTSKAKSSKGPARLGRTSGVDSPTPGNQARGSRKGATADDAGAAGTPLRRGKGKGKSKGRSDAQDRSALEAQRAIKLSSRQKEGVKALWDMFKKPFLPGSTATATGGFRGRGREGMNSSVLGRDEVKKWVRDMGEMWSDDEITDMVTLFSTQHEGRGLSYDDFSQVMARAKIV